MNNKVDAYINKQRSPQKEICQKLRTLIVNTFPGIKEDMKWGVPTYHDGIFYIVALEDHVNLGFSIRGLTKEEMSLFDGDGKTMKHVEVDKLANIDENRIVELLKLVDKRASA